MKIEKVNENQIRCTLTKEDLASRELKISELAYGTEKAKSLFRDMMQQANFQFGFEADDIPLMIEAIPMNAECIVLIITKVEDPEELDTRFSRFAPSVHEDEDMENIDINPVKDDVLELFQKIQAENPAGQEDSQDGQSPQKEQTASKPSIRLFQFDSLRPLLQVAGQVGEYEGISALYRDPQTKKYLLLLSHEPGRQEQFNRLCNFSSEYGTFRKALPSTVSFLEEHYSVIIPANAIQLLSRISQ